MSPTMCACAELWALLVLQALLLGSADAAGDTCPSRNKPVGTNETKLHYDLTCNYVSSSRPVKDYKNTVEVKIRFAIKYMSFDTLEEIFTIHSWVAYTWKDEYLTWNPSDYGDIKETLIESSDIWTPSMSLFNADADTGYLSDLFSTTCIVNNEGTVKCVPLLSHSGICKTSLQWWPYDIQNCTLYFGSWMHTGEQVNFTFYKKHPIVLNDYHDSPGWQLMNAVYTRLPGTYSCCPNSTYPMLKYTFVLRRESAGPAAIVAVPSVVVVILTLTSLLLDIKNNVRLTLACFSLLGHFTLLTEISYDIPKHSSASDTPVILLFLRDSMIVTLASILVTLVMMSLRQRTVPAPTWVVSVTRLVSRGAGKYVVFTEFDPSTSMEKKQLAAESDDSNSNGRHLHTSEWIQFANLLNSCVFIISLLIYLVLICNYLPYEK